MDCNNPSQILLKPHEPSSVARFTPPRRKKFHRSARLPGKFHNTKPPAFDFPEAFLPEITGSNTGSLPKGQISRRFFQLNRPSGPRHSSVTSANPLKILVPAPLRRKKTQSFRGSTGSKGRFKRKKLSVTQMDKLPDMTLQCLFFQQQIKTAVSHFHPTTLAVDDNIKQTPFSMAASKMSAKPGETLTLPDSINLTVNHSQYGKSLAPSLERSIFPGNKIIFFNTPLFLQIDNNKICRRTGARFPGIFKNARRSNRKFTSCS